MASCVKILNSHGVFGRGSLAFVYPSWLSPSTPSRATPKASTHTPGTGSRAAMCAAHNGAALRISSRSGWPVHYANLGGQRRSCETTKKDKYEGNMKEEEKKNTPRKARRGKNCSRAWFAADGPITAVIYARLTITLRGCEQPRRRDEIFPPCFRLTRHTLAGLGGDGISSVGALRRSACV